MTYEHNEGCPEPTLFWNPNFRGTSCGGLDLVGALVCDACGAAFLTKQSRPADDVDWRLAKGGRSLDAGSIRIRAEAKGGGDVAAVMARIVRLPELERALREIANGAPNAFELARAALGVDDMQRDSVALEEHADAE